MYSRVTTCQFIGIFSSNDYVSLFELQFGDGPYRCENDKWKSEKTPLQFSPVDV
jgi:hypothetical protein